jgi:hypothetical protein
MQLTKDPIPGIPIVEPERMPLPGERLIGYEQIPAAGKTFVSPRPSHMKTRGWVSVVLLTFFMWPLAFVPCFTSCSYYQMQRPVYSSARELPADLVVVDASPEPKP